MDVKITTYPMFRNAYAAAREDSPRVREATSEVTELNPTVNYYLTPDRQSGFGITPESRFVALFSLVPGRGNDLVQQAILFGARSLDCFDGYLPALYARHGFKEIARTPNWNSGGPDVIEMELES